MVNFLGTLKEMGRELWTLVLLNSGVKLACTGSEVLTTLQELEAAGVQVLVCGTCLNHFKLLEAETGGGNDEYAGHRHAYAVGGQGGGGDLRPVNLVMI